MVIARSFTTMTVMLFDCIEKIYIEGSSIDTFDGDTKVAQHVSLSLRIWPSGHWFGVVAVTVAVILHWVVVRCLRSDFNYNRHRTCLFMYYVGLNQTFNTWVKRSGVFNGCSNGKRINNNKASRVKRTVLKYFKSWDWAETNWFLSAWLSDNCTSASSNSKHLKTSSSHVQSSKELSRPRLSGLISSNSFSGLSC